MGISLTKTQRAAVLLLGGSGLRFGGDKPKQFTLVNGKLLFLYPLEKLQANKNVEAILLVAPHDYVDFVTKTVQELGISKVVGVIPGGETRQDSSRRATSFLVEKGLAPSSLVMVHDADRPNLLDHYIDEGFAKALPEGASVTAILASDSIAVSGDGKCLEEYKNRATVFQLQTPQTFVLSLLSAAHEEAYEKRMCYTDEGSMVLEQTGVKPVIVLGERSNVKITTVDDLVELRRDQP